VGIYQGHGELCDTDGAGGFSHGLHLWVLVFFVVWAMLSEARSSRSSLPGIIAILFEADHVHELNKVYTNAGSYEVRDMVSSVTEVAHGDPHMACHLWVLVFPIVWATLSEKKEQQIQLAKPIIALLSKEYHLKQAQHRPNVVQVICHPPKIFINGYTGSRLLLLSRVGSYEGETYLVQYLPLGFHMQEAPGQPQI